MKVRKKLIEVALPLDAINKASAREKSIRHGHPSTLHLWWARRPLAAARAVLFSQMVDDPSEYIDVLMGDPAKKRSAQAELKKRQAAWEDRLSKYEAAQNAGNGSVPEPGPAPTLEECLADQERQRLFRIIEDLVLWENTTNEQVLEKARAEIWQSWRRTCAENADHPQAKELFDRNKLPAFHDPFAGGGSIPLEAQRLGLEAYASDLNPVAVLINKAMIEIPPKFAGRPPVGPLPKGEREEFGKDWSGAKGLAEDVRRYGAWMREEAFKRIGHLYPPAEITKEMVEDLENPRPDLKQYIGQKLTVVAWLWARTVKSPNPAFRNVDVPLASCFMLSTKTGKEAYVEPIIENGGYRFSVKVGKPQDAEAAKSGTKLARGANFRCLLSGTPIQTDYIRTEAQAGRMGAKLMAIIAGGDHGRLYLTPTEEQSSTANGANPLWKPDLKVPFPCHDVDRLPMYGMPTWGDAFTRRQLMALTTFSDLVQEAIKCVKSDAMANGLPDDSRGLEAGGTGASAYAEAVGVYLGMMISKMADTQSSFCRWKTTMDQSIATFSRQAIPMVWDYSEANAFGNMAGDPIVSLNNMMRVVLRLSNDSSSHVIQADAQNQNLSKNSIVSTDPPYFDNISYADLSDFFYIWLRRSLFYIFPKLFSTLATPKAEELVATPYRHGGKQKAEKHFLDGMTQALKRLSEQVHNSFPVTIYYAFKQSEDKDKLGNASTGWETFLDAVINAGFALSGTWPMRTELSNRMVGMGTNALASSIVLVCRRQQTDAPTSTRRAFLAALKAELPAALRHLQRCNIAPVDLAQAAIGPGMAVFTRCSQVLDADGKPLPVRSALAIINEVLDEVLAEQEGDFEADTRWAITWFEQNGFSEGEFGDANVLAQARNTSVEGLMHAGILFSKAGKVRLLKPDELPVTWDPATDPRLTVWEMVHHLIRVLNQSETAAAGLLAKLGAKAEPARELAYRLYTMCERKKRAAEALAYNTLVISWPEIARLAKEAQAAPGEQANLI
jgi:putative DNA methylase